MHDSVSDRKKSALERRLANLAEEYEAASAQLDRTSGDVERLRIQRQIKDLDEQMQAVASQLDQLESSGGDPNRRHLGFEDKIPEIDYEPAATIAQTILTGFGRRGGAALFLLQRSAPLGGGWFIARVKRLLEGRATCVRHCRREIPPHGRRDEIGLLDILADEFGVERVPEDADAYARAIVRAIRGFVRGSTTLLIDVRRWDDLCPQERILPWFLEHFWAPLVHELPAITETYRNVKFVGILSASHEIPETCLGPPYCCTPDDPDDERVLELPLREWTREEIQEWLEMYVFLGNPRRRPGDAHPDSPSEPEPYIASPELIQAVNLAMYVGRPLLLEGEAGCGKTRLARALAFELGLPYYPWPVRSTSKARDGLYRYDAILRLHDVQTHQLEPAPESGAEEPVAASPRERRDPSNPVHYRELGALGKAFTVEDRPAVVLIDEIDKADIDFPNDLLNVLDAWEFDIPETGEPPIPAQHKPIVIITSNKEKGNLPAPFLREAPSPSPELVTAAVQRFLDVREDTSLHKKPGTSEFLDWLKALHGFKPPLQEPVSLSDAGSIPYRELLFKLRADWQRAT